MAHLYKMSFLTANRIHNGHKWLPDGTTIEVADDGTILAIHDSPTKDTTTYEGILTPGFVNAHCHIELSHMKGVVPERTGLIPFLKTIPRHRNDFTDEQKKTARHNAYHELLKNGVVAVGDIANTTDTLDVRALGQLNFYTFVESIGFTEANAQKAFAYAISAYETFATQQGANLKQAIIPHAPYSVSSPLFRLIDAHARDVVISIHNQESEEENKFYTKKEGGVRDLLQTLGVDDSFFTPTGRSSLQSYLQWLSPTHPFIFVHNTYTRRQDVQFAHSRLKDVYWCLCPNANLYIENTLPDIDMFISENANICIGTDSLASNHQLSVLSELQTIKERYPHLTWETLLTWGTRNGALALQMPDIGTIEVGKKPGVVEIAGMDGGSPAVRRVI